MITTRFRPELSALSLALVVAVACSPSPAPSEGGPAGPAISGTGAWAAPGARGAEAEIYKAWIHHLAVKGGRYSSTAGIRTDDWDPAEQEQWVVHELAALYLPDGARPEVLSIAPEPGSPHEYRVVTAFHSPDASNSMRSRLVRLTIFARSVEGRWRFGNALPRLTSGWRREQAGTITYLMPPDYPFARERARRAAAFVDSLVTAFGVPAPGPITYYLTTSSDEVYRVIGLETDERWGSVGGVAQPVNRLLFSGIPALGENYRHELTHVVIMPLLLGHATPYFVSEGVPTWLGGTTGLDFPTAARGLADFLTGHPDITLDTLMSRSFPVAQYYPAGAVFVDMTFREGGTAAVKSLFDAGVTPAAFRTSAERLFGKPWPEIAADWRAHALSFQRGPS